MRAIMNKKELAEYLNISISMINKMLREKKSSNIPHFHIGSRVLFRLDDIDEWVDRNKESNLSN